MFRLRRAAVLVAVAFASASLVRSAAGYVLEGPRWQTATLNVVVQLPTPPVPLKDGSLSYTRSFENAMMLWNEQLANFQFTWTEATPGSPAADGDGTTQVTMQSTFYGTKFSSGTLAVTLLNDVAGRTTETDIIFNSAYSFNSYRGNLGAAQDFHRIALHELGHVLGLDHPDEAKQTVVALMNANVSDLDSLQRDDVDGAQSLYGASPNAPSLGDDGGRLANISTRGVVGTDDAVMIGGFIVTKGSKRVVIRALGPSLPLGGTLADPVLELHGPDGAVITTNNDWHENPQAQIIAANGLAPTNDREAAIYAELPPANYTAVVRGNGGASGVALVELYDLDGAAGMIANISTRGQIGTGDNVLIGGFIIGGVEARAIIARAIGPSLRNAIPGAISDPMLELRNSNGEVLASNNDWGSSSSNRNAISDANFAPSDPLESAVLTHLVPGNYTAIVRGNNDVTGIGLVEIYGL